MNRIEKLKEIIKEKELTQEALARELGVSLMTIFRWLHGINRPKGLSLKVIDEWIEGNKKDFS